MCARTYQTQPALQPYCTMLHHLTKLIFPHTMQHLPNRIKHTNYKWVQLLTSDTPSPHVTSEN